MKFSLLISALLLSASFNAFAENAKTLSVNQEIAINAPAEKVWAKVSNFDDLGAWHPAVKKTQIVKGDNNKVGAERLLTLQDDGTIREKLLSYNANENTFKYSIIEGVLPVSNYVSSLTVKATGKNTSSVIWKGDFKRQDLSAAPAEGQDDATAIKVITSVYQGGLENLKKITE